MKIKCGTCGIRKVQKHANSKWCKPCAIDRRKRPRHTLTPQQQREVRALARKIPQKEISEVIGASRSSVIRFAREAGISLDSLSYPESVVHKVCAYYEKHGKPATQKKFPDVSVRSIIERHKLYKPRQIRWTAKQQIELARMAGLVSHKYLAKYFDRPRANEGSIKSAYMKKFGKGCGGVNGLSYWVGKHYVTERCPIIKTDFWSTRRETKGKHTRGFSRKLYLWVDIEKHMRPNVPAWFRDCVRVCAKFQRWLHGTSRVRSQVLKYVKESRSEK